MSRLVKDMYKNTSREKPGLFGIFTLFNDESRSHIGASVWFNQRGEKLGLGQLTAKEIKRIALQLEADEYFFIVDYDDDFGAHFEQRPPINLRKDAFLVIGKGVVYTVLGNPKPDYFYDEGNEALEHVADRVLHRDQMEAILAGLPVPA